MPNTHAQLQMGGNNDKKTVEKLQQLLNQQQGAGLTVDGIFGARTDAAVRAFQKANAIGVDGIVGPKTWGALLKTQEPVITESQRAKEALDGFSANAPGDFAFDRQHLLDLAEQAWRDREAFAYDPNADAVYRRYKDHYATQGKRAMEDTMGLAQTMTGGYGSSYSQLAGQQAYNQHLEKLGDVLPRLYELAYEKWSDGGKVLQSHYESLLSQKETAQKQHETEKKQFETRQKELYNAWQDALQQEQRAYNKLKTLIAQGYVPTQEELAAAGMNRQMALALAGGKK